MIETLPVSKQELNGAANYNYVQKEQRQQTALINHNDSKNFILNNSYYFYDSMSIDSNEASITFGTSGNQNGGADELNLSSHQENMSPLNKLIYDMRNDPQYLKEYNLGNLIGFYRIGREIGVGNFSKVKLGIHLLARGN
jgi:hypothetical protein